MTNAGVHDSIQLEFPEWFPSALRVAAEEQFAAEIKAGASVDIQNRLRRLIAHPDMKKVWYEFYRKKRNDRDQFYNPANPIKPFSGFLHEMRRHIVLTRRVGSSKQLSSAEFLERLLYRAINCSPLDNEPAQVVQDFACRKVLRLAMGFARSSGSVFTANEMKLMNKHFKETARKLQDEAWMARAFKIGEEEATKLESVAETYLRKAEMCVPDPDELLEVKRKRGDGVVRAYVLRLAQTMVELFGKQLSGCTAIMTNVVFETNFRGTHVREMTRGQLRSGA